MKTTLPHSNVTSNKSKLDTGFSADTQVMTPTGWKLISQLNNSDKILQVNKMGYSEFVKPINRTVIDYSGELVHWFGKDNRMDALVGPGNYIEVMRPPRLDSKYTNTKIERYQSYTAKNGNRYTYQITSAPIKGLIHKLTYIDRLNIAFQADGSDVNRYNDVVFAFAKLRKIYRLKNIIKKLNLNYRTSHIKRNGKNQSSQIRFSIDIPKNIKLSKTLDWVNFKDKSSTWTKEFLNEVSKWDAHETKTHFVYYSNVRENVDIIEMAAVLSGYTTRRGVDIDSDPNHSDTFHITVAYNNKLYGKMRKKEFVEYTGKLYQIEVPSGLLITKRNLATLILPDSSI